MLLGASHVGHDVAEARLSLLWKVIILAAVKVAICCNHAFYHYAIRFVAEVVGLSARNTHPCPLNHVVGARWLVHLQNWRCGFHRGHLEDPIGVLYR